MFCRLYAILALPSQSDANRFEIFFYADRRTIDQETLVIWCPMNQIDGFIEILMEGKLLPAHACKFICHKVQEILAKESNVLQLDAPVTVVGDVHGQFWDVLELFRSWGKCPDTRYLFMGDFVDRGGFSLETISLLVCLKIRYSDRIWLIRGNHESRSVTRVYGFYEECTTRYQDHGMELWKAFTDMFDFLPVSALIGNQIFCTHGGLSPYLQSIDQVRALPRFQEIPFEGLLTDMMWSDPAPETKGFAPSNRGVGYTFGEDIVQQFLRINDIDFIIRAHQLCNEGYQTLFNNTFATIWSAPNYCYRARNKAAILQINEDLSKNFKVFEASQENTRKLQELTGYRSRTMEYFS